MVTKKLSTVRETGSAMSDKFSYKVQETTQDTRNFKIESDHKLTHSEILDLVGSCDPHPMADPYTDNGATITFVDTEFGDDSQLQIEGEYIHE